jgi:DNA invertase Pin-like site-specific DNA recombinase
MTLMQRHPQRGVCLLTAHGDDLTDTRDPSREMMRQVAGAFAEYEKTRLVEKLAAARKRKREDAGKRAEEPACSGSRSWQGMRPGHRTRKPRTPCRRP